MLTPLDGLNVNALLNHLPQWTHLSEPLGVRDASLSCEVNLLFRREPPDAEPDGRVSQILVSADSAENIGWLQRGRGASTPRRQSDVFQRHEETFTLDVSEGQINAAGVRFRGIAVSDNIRAFGHNFVDESV